MPSAPCADHLGGMVGVVAARPRGIRRAAHPRQGLLQIEDSIAFVQGVQGVFHPPQRFKDWPDDDRENRLVCISRDIPEEDIALTLPALNTPAGTQAIYSMQQLRERS